MPRKTIMSSLSSTMGLYECKGVEKLRELLMCDRRNDQQEDSSADVEQCIIATLHKVRAVARLFAKHVSREFVSSFLENNQTDKEWETTRVLSLAVLATSDRTMYSFSHAQWLEKLRRLRLMWNRLKTDPEKSTKLTQIMNDLNYIQTRALEPL